MKKNKSGIDEDFTKNEQEPEALYYSDLHPFGLQVNDIHTPYPVVNNSGNEIDIVSSLSTKDYIGNNEEYKGDFIPEMCVLRKTKNLERMCSSIIGQVPNPQNVLNPDTFYEF